MLLKLRTFIIIIFASVLMLSSCGHEHIYSKLEMNAEEHWAVCGKCGAENYRLPHDWKETAVETDENGEYVRTVVCTICGQMATEKTEPDTDVTNDEWDEALSSKSFDNVTVDIIEKTAESVYNVRYGIDGELVSEKITRDGVLQASGIKRAEESYGKKYVLQTVSPFVDTFGGFEYNSDTGLYCYERTEDDGSVTSFTFGFEFGKLTYFKTVSGEDFTLEFFFSDYGKTLVSEQ